MTDSIIQLRERLVELSKDPIETRKLLDQLTEEEIDDANVHSPFHVGEKDIMETKDLEFAKVHKTRDGFVLHYHGGYSVKVDNKLINTCGALQSVMDGVPEDVTDQNEREAFELANSAVEMVFRMPMFVFSNAQATYSVATIATEYMLLLQKMGEVPTEETENEEYDRYLVQVGEFMENAIKGLEKEGREYERRMGITHEEDGQGTEKGESQGQGESETEA